MKSKGDWKGGPNHRPMSQRGRVSKPEQMNLKTWLQVPTESAKKIAKKTKKK